MNVSLLILFCRLHFVGSLQSFQSKARLCNACNLVGKFSNAFCYVTPVTLLLSFNNKKTAPGGDLIRVDLIRFPGSIPGDKKICGH